MQVIKKGETLTVEPETPELGAALNAIMSHHNPDSLVTYALRRHGFGNDDWDVTYPHFRE